MQLEIWQKQFSSHVCLITSSFSNTINVLYDACQSIYLSLQHFEPWINVCKKRSTLLLLLADQFMCVCVSVAFCKLGMVPQSVWLHPLSPLLSWAQCLTEASRNEMAFVTACTHTEDAYQEKCNFLPAEGSVYHMLTLSCCQARLERGCNAY